MDRKCTGKFSFFCKGIDGYYIFRDILYAVGKPTKFEDLRDDLKDCNSIALVGSDSDASLITKALNFYEENSNYE